MARYFFDTSDGELSLDDEVGEELDCADAARRMALASLPDMARDKVLHGDRRVFRAQVRDETGAVVYTATLTLVAGWGAATSKRSM